MEKLDRLVWAASNTYRIGPVHIGIRTDSEWLEGVIRGALSAYHVPSVDAPANFSVAVPRDDHGAVQGLNMLYEGHTNLVRSRHPERVLWALFQHLAKYLPTGSNGFLRVSNLALVHKGRAILVPRGVVTWMDLLAPRLNRAGWQFVDQPWSTVDLSTSELVVPPPMLEIDGAWESEIDASQSQREPEPIGPGRYRLAGWGVFSAEQRVMTPAAAVAAAARAILNPMEFGVLETLERMLGLVERIPVTGLGSPQDGDFPARLMAVDPN